MKKSLWILVAGIVVAGSVFLWKQYFTAPPKSTRSLTSQQRHQPSPSTTLRTPSEEKILPNDYQVFQTFNNCGPASLSMALSFYGINKTQEELGQLIRPYQHPKGDNDDKSVTLEELAATAQTFGLVPYHRPNGTMELLKLFITYDIPVITRTWLNDHEDIGHYRVVKGYDKDNIIQSDSYQGKNKYYSHDAFDNLWKKFNYEYLVLVPKEKQAIAEAILKEDLNEMDAWKYAVTAAEEELKNNPEDMYARFNLSVALYNTGNYQRSINEYEKVSGRLPARTLWYQIEPIQAYVALKQYDKALSLIDRILNNGNRAFSELYIIRGNIYKDQGNIAAAKSEYEKAVLYNKNLQTAKDALLSVSS